LIGTIKRKPARAADGLTDEEAGYSHVKDTSIMHDLRHLGGKNMLNMAHALKDLSSGEPMDDRGLMLEHGGESNVHPNAYFSLLTSPDFSV